MEEEPGAGESTWPGFLFLEFDDVRAAPGARSARGAKNASGVAPARTTAMYVIALHSDLALSIMSLNGAPDPATILSMSCIVRNFTTHRGLAAAGSFLFLALAPGALAGLRPCPVQRLPAPGPCLVAAPMRNPVTIGLRRLATRPSSFMFWVLI